MKKFYIYSFGHEAGDNTNLWGIETTIESTDKVQAVTKFTSSHEFERMLENDRSIFIAVEQGSIEEVNFINSNIIMDDTIEEVLEKYHKLVLNYTKDYISKRFI